MVGYRRGSFVADWWRCKDRLRVSCAACGPKIVSYVLRISLNKTPNDSVMHLSDIPMSRETRVFERD